MVQNELIQEDIQEIDIEESLKGSYLDYSMSVIIGRALPDARDGLKPVHRRILYAMNQLGITSKTQYKKSARIVGDVIGKYHPHGDSSVYDALVRMAQSFAMRIPLIDGQGNFGSIDGDNAAAMRYCLTGESRVKTDRGLIKIEELVKESKLNSDSDIDIEVLSLGKKVNSSSKFFNSGFHKIYNLETREGFSIRGSSNHPILTLTRDSNKKPIYRWKTLENIDSSDKILIDRSEVNLVKKETTKRDINLAIILGSLISEGFVSEDRLGFNNTDRDYFEKFTTAWSEEFGDSFYLLNRELKSGKTLFEFDVQLRYSKDAKKIREHFIYRDLVDVKSKDKYILNFIFESNRDIQRVFLQHLFEGDGSVSISKRYSINIHYSSFSHKLVKDIQLLLLEFGVISKISKSKNSNEFKLYISNYSEISKFHERVSFASKKREKLNSIVERERERRGRCGDKSALNSDFIPFISEYIRANIASSYLKRNNFDRFDRAIESRDKILSEMQNTLMQSLYLKFVDDNYYFATVKSCKVESESERVYSIRVDSQCHSFVANGLINHNTEARMTAISEELLKDIERDTVDFVPNYDDSDSEPDVLPSRVPNLLLNGSSGIAVGMATNIPPHNLRELIDGLLLVIENPNASLKEIMNFIKAPDFPTGGTIFGKSGILNAYSTGRGRIKIRAKTHIETKGSKEIIVVDELPYQVNKSRMIEQIATLVKEKQIEGISEVRDESDRDGIRVVIELKRDAMSEVILNNLFKSTNLEVTFGIMLIAIKEKEPKLFTLIELLNLFLKHRKTIIIRRTIFELERAKKRAHILEGLKVALESIDEIVQTIKASSNSQEARENLIEKFKLSEIQANAILDMKLNRLTSLEIEKIEIEHQELLREIEKLSLILKSEEELNRIIKEELIDVKERFSSDRLTQIEDNYDEIDIKDLIPNEEVVVTITHRGYIKRVPSKTYEKQNRGGKGKTAVTTYEDDFIESFFTANSHDTLMFVTDKGQLYWLEVYKIPEAGRVAKGKAIVNLVNLTPEEKIKAIINTTDFSSNKSLIFFTKNGTVKRTNLSEFSNIRSNGVRAIILDDSDELVTSKIITENSKEIFIATKKAQAIRFRVDDVREIGRSAKGVKGVKFKSNLDEVIGASIIESDSDEILTMSEKGIGKRTRVDKFNTQKRGGSGTIAMKLTTRTGDLVGIIGVDEDSDLMALTSRGKMIRVETDTISSLSRNTQGVKIINAMEDRVISIAKCIKLNPQDED